ncbi:hypothetical protein FRC03_011493 [Tulasnella sp. 419]|nr:hypothetical protein FRC02_008053 [Tulasnella sp. 418]KAG8954333.1 hypothetical protein FRC03_011493 [Tulasnella sp. 419]
MEPSKKYFRITARGIEDDDSLRTYTLKRNQPIGMGSYGEVYLAIADTDGSEIAVKILKSDILIIRKEAFISPREAAQRFTRRLRREADIWTGLNHPNIAPLLGYWIAPQFDGMSLVTPYYPNGTVKEYTKGKSAEYKLKILHQISMGLRYLHSRSIVHHDVKGTNVLVDNNDNAVIIDFGVAYQPKKKLSCNSSNISGDSRWLPPEVVLRNELYDAPYQPKISCDIWSFGCLMLEIFSESDPWIRYPYSKSVTSDEMRKAMTPEYEEKPGYPGEYVIDPRVYALMWELGDKCWEYEESERPPISYFCSKLQTSKGLFHFVSTVSFKIFRH